MTSKNIKLIGLSGKAGSGKDTVGIHIKNNYNGINYAFADPIKELTRTLFLFDDEQLYGSKKELVDERWGITPRQSWQIIGTNIMQFAIYGLLPDLLKKVPVRQFWIYHFRMWYQKFIDDPANQNKTIIVTDVRFPHEADLIRELGGTLIRIERPNLDLSDVKYQHSSETSSVDITPDIVIINDNTMEELYKKTDEILQNM